MSPARGHDGVLRAEPRKGDRRRCTADTTTPIASPPRKHAITLPPTARSRLRRHQQRPGDRAVPVLPRARHDAEDQRQQPVDPSVGEEAAHVVLAREGVVDRQGAGSRSGAPGRVPDPASAQNVRVVLNFRSSEATARVTCSASAPLVSSRNTLSSDWRGRYSSNTATPLSRRRRAHRPRATRPAPRATRPPPRRARPSAPSWRGERGAQPVGIGAPHPHRRLDARGELLERALRHQPPAADHNDLVHRLRHLGQHVARHEHGAPGARPGCGGSRAASGFPAGPARWRARRGPARAGSPSSAPARPSRWRIPSEYALHALVARALQLDEPRAPPPRGCAASPAAAASTRRWLRPGAPGMELRALEHGADDPDRIRQQPVREAVDHRVARGGQREAQQHAQCRGLSGAVGAEEAEHAPRARLEAQAVHGEVRAVPLCEVAYLDHRRHHTSGV